MKQEYRTIDTSTPDGLKQAERLHNAGWKTGSVGIYTIQFHRDDPKAVRNAQRRADNATLRELCGTSARAARMDMGL